MSEASKRLGVLSGGGDCPGINAVIRAVTKTALFEHGFQVYGIEDGFLGLVEGRLRQLRNPDVSNILTLGGTILGANNKIDPTRYPVSRDGTLTHENRMGHCLHQIERYQLDALIIIGGNGTMAVAQHFAEAGVNCIGVPKTIDNDLPGTEQTFGFASAVSVATEALDRVHTTAASHHRAMVVEVMGREAGWLALYAGTAAGADVILLPEMSYSLEAVQEKVNNRSKEGKRFSIICAAEGAAPAGGEHVVSRYDPTSNEPIRLGGVSQRLADQIEKQSSIETRYTILGHIQRGGTPVAEDRVLATQLGYAAVERFVAGSQNRMIAIQAGGLTDIPLTDAAGGQRLVPGEHPLIQAARAVGTSFGQEERSPVPTL
jgi:6-phosphofructokinase 1